MAVVDANRDRLEVVGLTAGNNTALFSAQIARYRPLAIAMASHDAVEQLGPLGGLTVGVGREGLALVASQPEVDLVLCASSGTEGLDAVLAAIECRKTVALANKEVLVMAGGLVMEAARRTGATVLPVDSEHNAIHQCLHGRAPSELKRLILTASGGPFRGRSPAELARVTAADALRHPTWRMGRKITIDSATLMNKGLEVVEAHWLFGMRADQIEVLVHPQSVVHSMVELVDGSVIAQLAITDMRLPIQYAFSYPDRWDSALPSLDLATAGRLDFDRPDMAAFPCLTLAYRALAAERSLPVVLNAANEVAVARFLEGRVGFCSIPHVIERTMDAHQPAPVSTLAEVRAVDRWAREQAGEVAGEVESNR